MKHLFLLDPSLVFLNHGSFGACPAEVLERQHAWQRELERNPVAFLGRRSAALLEEARTALGRYLGADPAHLVFVPNATTGVNTVARSLPLLRGDEILTTDHEYGACATTWAFACRRSGARVVPVEIPLPFDAAAFTERIWAGVTARTRVLYLSHITSVTALVFPIAELCRRARREGILTVIDGAHAPGQVPLDLEDLGADFYTGNCHKWMCAPKGSAFLHARPEHHALLDSPVVSWGYRTEELGEPGHEPYAGRTLLEHRLQWQGTRDLSAFLTVPAAIDFQARHGWGAVRKDCHALAADTLRRVCALTGLEPVCADADFGQMVVLPVPATDGDRLKAALFDRFRIEVPVTSLQGRLFVRASFQAYNTREDADALVTALGELVGR